MPGYLLCRSGAASARNHTRARILPSSSWALEDNIERRARPFPEQGGPEGQGGRCPNWLAPTTRRQRSAPLAYEPYLPSAVGEQPSTERERRCPSRRSPRPSAPPSPRRWNLLPGAAQHAAAGRRAHGRDAGLKPEGIWSEFVYSEQVVPSVRSTPSTSYP